jgi:hypothetical protein
MHFPPLVPFYTLFKMDCAAPRPQQGRAVPSLSRLPRLARAAVRKHSQQRPQRPRLLPARIQKERFLCSFRTFSKPAKAAARGAKKSKKNTSMKSNGQPNPDRQQCAAMNLAFASLKR